MDAASFRRLSHREHVMHRPDMYIGAVSSEPCCAWVLDDAGERMQLREGLIYCPAMLKVVDEMLVNAIDHATRRRQLAADAVAAGRDAVDVVKKIEVRVDRATGVVSVSNDGDGIPVVVKHEASTDQPIYVPELIFGHLLTSANYDDDDDQGKRVVGGQNGIGAKACNIMSKWFEVEVVDRHRHLRFRQRFEENMSVIGKPSVEKCALKKSSTAVRFLPDYARLGMGETGGLSNDMHALVVKRVYDAAAVTPADVAVWLDGKRLEVKTFERYIDLYVGARGAAGRAYERPCDGWEVAAALSDGTGLKQVSFVNGVATLRGGKHVDHVVNQICRKLCDLVATRRKGGASAGPPPKPQYVRDNLLVFVRATVPGPRFDSQSKETLTTPPGQFGGKVEVSDAFVEKMYKLEGLVDRVVGLSGVAADKEARKTDGSKRATVSVPKLDDAEWAGTARSGQCTLILTEGDSAKASAVAGLSVVGRDKYGVFPLRGKVMNVCEVSADRVAANAEISAIKKILGLQTGRAYASTAELRYGRVMLMTDADSDGSHIKGLVMNLFLQQWPTLLRVEGFLCTLLTPIVKVWPAGDPAKRSGPKVGGGGGGSKGPVVHEFYNLGDFELWKRDSSECTAKAHSKYYKGLGTSTAEEARDWFRRMRLVVYTWEDDEGRSREALGKAFDKRRADDRKAWLQAYDPARTLDYGTGDVSFTEFVERDLVHFSNYDVLRSIPSAVDGLKVSQRKAMFGCRKRNLVRGELRVAQLAAYAAEHACFHHGEASMQGTLIGMAQDFVGSGNNAPLLEALGQFGTRLTGGDDWASPRYIHTRLTRLASALLPSEDDAVLEYLCDDGIPVEPRHYLPVLPLVLINGAAGIGTGYSTNVPSYDPLEIVAAVRAWIGGARQGRKGEVDKEETDPVSLQLTRPWYRGFRGRIEAAPATGRLRSRGVLERVGGAGGTRVRVTELPIGTWTEDFKNALDTLVDKHADVKSVQNASSESTIDFLITFASAAAVNAWMAPAKPATANAPVDATVSRLEAELKMLGVKGLSTTNMHLFNARGQIQKYATPDAIVEEFCVARFQGYVKRRGHLVARLTDEVDVLRNRVLFLDLVADGRLRLQDTPAPQLAIEMEAAGLRRMSRALGAPEDKEQHGGHVTAESDDVEGETGEEGFQGGTYTYLLSMQIASMTAKRRAQLNTQMEGKQRELHAAETSTAEDMWSVDLDRFEVEYRLLPR